MRLTRAEIHLENLRHNFGCVRRTIGDSVKIMGIVKANAYGHGLVEISQALVSLGVEYLGVGFVEEGILLRQSGIRVPVLVLGGVLGSQIGEFLEYDLEITVSSIEIAERIDREVPLYNRRKAKVHLKIDTGMERIGVHAENAPQFAERVAGLKNLEVVGIYSHLATSGEKEKTFTSGQLERFSNALEKIRALGIQIPLQHIANSAAVLELPESHFSMVRPGIMLYGVPPSGEDRTGPALKPVLSLKSNVVFTKEVQPNVSVSYGRRYFTVRKTRLATVPVGYGDGYSRGLTNKGEVLIRRKRYPVVGAVCMDQIMVDVGPEVFVHVGDEVTLLGSEGPETISAWEIAHRLGTIPYEFLSGIAARVPRMYIQ